MNARLVGAIAILIAIAVGALSWQQGTFPPSPFGKKEVTAIAP